LKVSLALHKDHVEVIFTNMASTELRLWELWNSWGYWSVSFQLRSEPDSTISTIMHRWNAEFTVNGPTYFVLAPGEQRRFPININDGWWMRDQTVSRMRDKTLYVRASYNADPIDPDWLKSFLSRSNLPDFVRQDNARQASELVTV